MTSFSQTILMCPPDYFGVSYVINPWMEGHFHDIDQLLAHKQWIYLRDALAQHAKIVLQPPQKGLPDLVFTANAGIVLGSKAIVSRFRNVERQGEEPHDRAWFSANGFEIIDWPLDISFEGAGDALFDRQQSLLWVGQGFRSVVSAPALLEKKLGRKTAVLHLTDPRFYHLDTCLCPLPGGYVMYFPGAFDNTSRRLIESLVEEDKRLPVREEDALKFCCNAVDLNGHIFLNDASNELQNQLSQTGFNPVLTPLSEFMKAGGAAKCLTLKLLEV
jgi:N-dimethylarginine dimethylaminohydrolase